LDRVLAALVVMLVAYGVSAVLAGSLSAACLDGVPGDAVVASRGAWCTAVAVAEELGVEAVRGCCSGAYRAYVYLGGSLVAVVEKGAEFDAELLAPGRVAVFTVDGVYYVDPGEVSACTGVLVERESGPAAALAVAVAGTAAALALLRR